MQIQRVIIKPIVTEKSMNVVGAGKFSFVVARYATKTSIRTVINKTFNVHVTAISTSVVKGKSKRVGAKRTEVSQSKWKKATVTLRKGEKISLFEAGTEEKKK